MRANPVLRWALAALVGMILAAALTYAASTLSSQHVGLSGEPLSVGAHLAPAATSTRTHARGERLGRDD